MAAAKRAFGRVDVLVNNAGYGYQASAEEGDDREIRAMFDANVFGLFQMTQAVLPIMRQQRDGRILNITSVAGPHGLSPAPASTPPSKHAVEGWADALAKEVAPLGIKVTNVEPGPLPYRLGRPLPSSRRRRGSRTTRRRSARGSRALPTPPARRRAIPRRPAA